MSRPKKAEKPKATGCSTGHSEDYVKFHCIVRRDAKKNCHDCIHYGKYCDRVKLKYDVKRPSDLIKPTKQGPET